MQTSPGPAATPGGNTVCSLASLALVAILAVGLASGGLPSSQDVQALGKLTHDGIVYLDNSQHFKKRAPRLRRSRHYGSSSSSGEGAPPPNDPIIPRMQQPRTTLPPDLLAHKSTTPRFPGHSPTTMFWVPPSTPFQNYQRRTTDRGPVGRTHSPRRRSPWMPVYTNPRPQKLLTPTWAMVTVKVDPVAAESKPSGSITFNISKEHLIIIYACSAVFILLLIFGCSIICFCACKRRKGHRDTEQDHSPAAGYSNAIPREKRESRSRHSDQKNSNNRCNEDTV